MNKLCKKCGNQKDISEFYKHSQMKDGYLNICISCKLLDVKKYRKNNIERIREYDRKRGLTEKKKEATKKYIKRLKTYEQDRYKTMRREAVRKNRNKDKEKQRARWRLQKAVEKGLVIRPKSCTLCGSKANLEGHHKDYNKPLEVIWLCRKCHGKIHRRKNSNEF